MKLICSGQLDIDCIVGQTLCIKIMLSKSKVCFQFAQTTEEILNVYEIFKNPSQNPLSLWIEPSPCAVSEGRKGRFGCGGLV